MGNLFSSPAANDWKSDARHAMEAGTFCVICGGPFDIEGDVYNIDPKDPRYQWLYEFRLLGNLEAGHSHMVASEDSAPLNESETCGIFLSEPAAFSISGSQFMQVPGHDGPRDIWYETMQHNPEGSTLFPLHEACLEIGRKAIVDHQSKHRKDSVEPELAVLTRLLNTRFTHRHTWAGTPDDIKNDLFGLCTSSNTYGPQSVLAMNRLEWWASDFERFYTNPAADFDTVSFVSRVLQNSPRSKPERALHLNTTRSPIGLERLPIELLDAICAYLPVRSTVALHRTSKALAENILLDNIFWRDSLRNGSLHPHIRDLDTKWIEQHLVTSALAESDLAPSWDWRGVAQLLATKRFSIAGQDARLADVPNEYWNRCRIWTIIEEALVEDHNSLFNKQRSDSFIELGNS